LAIFSACCRRRALPRSATVFIFAAAKPTPPVLAPAIDRKPLWREIWQLRRHPGDNREDETVNAIVRSAKFTLARRLL
jgi:hypothetical protein